MGEEYPEYQQVEESKPKSRPPSRQKPSSRPSSRCKSQTDVKILPRPTSVTKSKVTKHDNDDWEYYYEDEESKTGQTVKEACTPVIKVDNGLKLVSRPTSRNSIANSNSRPASR